MSVGVSVGGSVGGPLGVISRTVFVWTDFHYLIPKQSSLLQVLIPVVYIEDALVMQILI